MTGNTIVAIGNLTKDPELRYTNSGSAYCRFGLASSRRYQKDGEWTETTTFFDVVVWDGQLAENIAESLHKGAQAIVTGRLDQRSYTANDGTKRTAFDVAADSVGASLRFATVTVHKVERSDRAPARTGAREVDSDDPTF